VSRKDLLALTPEAVASLANLGLVKRAQREIAEGQGPQLEETPEGTVIGTFADKTVAKLIAGKTLKDSPCRATRRRFVAIVSRSRSRQPWHAAQLDGAPPPSSARVPTMVARRIDAALERSAPNASTARACDAWRLLSLSARRRPTAKLRPARAIPRAARSAYAVRLSRRAAGCERRPGRVGFREAQSHEGASIVVSLGGSTKKDGEALDAAIDLAMLVLREERHARAAAPMSASRPCARISTNTDTSGRSARSKTALARGVRESKRPLFVARSLGASLRARARSRASHVQANCRRFVLGQDEATVTPLDRVRLVSGRARTGRRKVRFAQVYLADRTPRWCSFSASGGTSKRTRAEEGLRSPRSVASRVTLGALAAGQVVSKVCVEGERVELGTSRTAMTSVTPQRGDWENLPSPILVKNLEEHDAWLKTRPPRALDRACAENVRDQVSSVDDVVYLPAEQQVSRSCRTRRHPSGSASRIVACAGAIDARLRPREARSFNRGRAHAHVDGLRDGPLSIAEEVMTVPTSRPLRQPSTCHRPTATLAAIRSRPRRSR
jgi:hypothetical protein